ANNDRMGNTLLFKAADRGHPVPFVPPVDAMHFTEEQLKYRKHSVEIPKEILETTTAEERCMLFDGYAQDYGYWWIEIPGEKENIIEEYEEIRDQLVRAVYGVWDHIKNGGDHGAENFELIWVGMLPGTRESRRVECDYMLTENDLLESRHFEDAVAYGGWHIDNHVGLFKFDQIPSFVYEVPGSYDIPYRSYCVKGFKNLFVGGRCMGASKLAMASSRVMGTCAIGGQAFGTAAAQLIENGKSDVREIDMAALQETLLRDDCYLPRRRNTDQKDLARTATVTATTTRAGYEAEKVISGVSRREGSETNAWRSEGLSASGEALTLALAAPAKVRTVQLTLDSNFDLEKKITLSSRRQNQQVTGIPAELLKDFDVVLYRNGEVVATEQVRGNYQRLCRVFFGGTECDTVALRALATNGTPDARVFEVRIYE
ncbi:MAG: FAD-dependent oxidoreductase, partial [Clostridia bacterium]|nr:FAD-dependent oxidoreductase [Clostridia bacterium]